MKTHEYRKLKDSEKKPCEAKTKYEMNNTFCKFTAKYRIGTKYLCTMHAKSESLKLITEQEEDLHSGQQFDQHK